MTKKYNRLLITGAAGMLGTEMRRELADVADTLRLNARKPFEDLAEHEEAAICDLADAEAVMEMVKGVDAVVHLGGVSKENTFEAILEANIRGFYNLYEACRKQGVKRVAWASSVHAVGFYPTTAVLDTDVPLRPDSNYGVSKAFGEALAPEFRVYAAQVVSNARAMSAACRQAGLDVVSGGTDTHLALIDLRPKNVTGRDAEAALERAYITCNKNGIPFDTEKPTITSGIRLGSPAGTTRGFAEEEFRQIGRWIVQVVDGLAAHGEDGNDAVEAAVKAEVEALCKRFPIYPGL